MFLKFCIAPLEQPNLVCPLPSPSAAVDAVVIDMMMGGDGMEASEALREGLPGPPIIISSGYTGGENIQPLLESGPTVLLEKPYQVDDLLRALAQVTRPGG